MPYVHCHLPEIITILDFFYLSIYFLPKSSPHDFGKVFMLSENPEKLYQEGDVIILKLVWKVP